MVDHFDKEYGTGGIVIDDEECLTQQGFSGLHSQGVCEGGRFLKPIKSELFFCYNVKNHKSGQKVVSKTSGKCPECGEELEHGSGGIPL